MILQHLVGPEVKYSKNGTKQASKSKSTKGCQMNTNTNRKTSLWPKLSNGLKKKDVLDYKAKHKINIPKSVLI